MGDQQWENLNSAFDGCTNLVEVASDAPDLSIVASLSEMFRRATNFTGDLSNWDVSTVPWMVSMFQDASAFNGDISCWDVSSCNSIRYMFNNASTFNQDISAWDVSLMATLQHTFDGATAFDQDLSAWDISNVTEMAHMFDNSGMSRSSYDKTINGWAANSASLQNGVTLGAANIDYCHSFHSRTILINANGWTIAGDNQDCTGATFITTWKTDNPGKSNSTSIEIPTNPSYSYRYDVDWDNDGSFEDIGVTGNITHDYGTSDTFEVAIRGQFPAIRFLNITDKEKILEVEEWGEITWETMDNAFRGCINLHITATDAPDLSVVTDMSNMFTGCIVFNESLDHWDVSNVQYMNRMFSEASSFNQSLNNWDVNNVQDISDMFYKASVFNQPLDRWVLDSLKFMEGVFRQATSFNQNINSWKIAGVNSLDLVFSGATSYNQPLDQWDVSNVISMYAMFSSAASFNQELGDWNVSSVRDLSSMFSGASVYDQPLDDWNVRVESIKRMFRGATSFNQPINNWDISGVSCLDDLFENATSFNQPLSDWETQNVVCMNRGFSGATAFNQHLDMWDVSNVEEMEEMFRGASSFNQPLDAWDISLVTNMSGLLDSCNMDLNNYDATLMAWAALTVQQGVNLGATGRIYCAGETARNILLSQQWNITGDTLDCSGPCMPQINTWIGPNIGNWDLASAWSLGTIPDSCSNVVIPNGKNVFIPASYQATCHLIELEAGGALETEIGAVLEVQGNSP